MDRASGDDVSGRVRALLAGAPELAALLARADVTLDVFQNAAGAACPASMAASFGAPYLGKLPLDPALQRACDAGEALDDAAPKGPAAAAFAAVVDAFLAQVAARGSRAMSDA